MKLIPFSRGSYLENNEVYTQMQVKVLNFTKFMINYHNFYFGVLDDGKVHIWNAYGIHYTLGEEEYGYDLMLVDNKKSFYDQAGYNINPFAGLMS